MVRFHDSQFLVLVNRVSALAVAVARLRYTRRPLVAAPLYKFAYCSLTNVVSTWCQYEALKYVSFPTQVSAGTQRYIDSDVTLVNVSSYLLVHLVTEVYIVSF